VPDEPPLLSRRDLRRLRRQRGDARALFWFIGAALVVTAVQWGVFNHDLALGIALAFGAVVLLRLWTYALERMDYLVTDQRVPAPTFGRLGRAIAMLRAWRSQR